MDNFLKKEQNRLIMKQYLGLLFGVLLCMPFMAQAETVLRIGGDISVDANQTIEGDYYVSSGPLGKVEMSGLVTEDMYAAGGSVVVNGDVEKDLSILAGTTQVHSKVSDDVRIIAADVTIAEDIVGDLFVLAGTLSVLSTASIGGDVFFFGDSVSIAGDVTGSVFGSAGSAVVDAAVGKDIDMKVGQLTLGDAAQIAGTVTYKSPQLLVRSQDSSVIGDITQVVPSAKDARGKARELLVPVFIVFFTTLVVYLLFKQQLVVLVQTIEQSFIKNILTGASVLVLGPVAGVLLMTTVIGMFVGLFTLLSVLLLYLISITVVSVVLGAYVMRIFSKKLTVSLLTIFVGAVMTQVLFFIPVVGPLCILIILALAAGAVAQRLYHAVT